jgi:putative toxin-antitoxin system antitoxin component (TIGR02293 family)
MPFNASFDDPFGRAAELLHLDLHIQSGVELHDKILRGLPRSSALHLAHGLRKITPHETLQALHMSRQTWRRIEVNKAERLKPLNLDHSGSVWRMAEVLVIACDVLGSRDDAEEWVTTRAIGLNSRRPIALMATTQGSQLVRTLLSQMAHGVYT